jgi:hypothetical protein
MSGCEGRWHVIQMVKVRGGVNMMEVSGDLATCSEGYSVSTWR